MQFEVSIIHDEDSDWRGQQVRLNMFILCVSGIYVLQHMNMLCINYTLSKVNNILYNIGYFGVDIMKVKSLV